MPGASQHPQRLLVVQELLQGKADCNKADVEGETALMEAHGPGICIVRFGVVCGPVTGRQFAFRRVLAIPSPNKAPT